MAADPESQCRPCPAPDARHTFLAGRSNSSRRSRFGRRSSEGLSDPPTVTGRYEPKGDRWRARKAPQQAKGRTLVAALEGTVYLWLSHPAQCPHESRDVRASEIEIRIACAKMK